MADQRTLDWTMSMLQAQTAMHNAVGMFSQVSDKEIANMASYRALGMHPADAPRFGWMLSDRPRVEVNTTNQNMVPGPVPPKNNMVLGIIAAVGVALLGLAAYGVMKPATNMNVTPADMQRQIESLKQQINDNRAAQQPKSAPLGTPDISNLQSEICVELDSDPAFATEIKTDLLLIGAKIKAHKEKRLGIK